MSNKILLAICVSLATPAGVGCDTGEGGGDDTMGESDAGVQLDAAAPATPCSPSDRVEYTVRVREWTEGGSLSHDHNPRLRLWDSTFGPSPVDDSQMAAETAADGTNVEFWYPNEFVYQGARRRHGIGLFLTDEEGEPVFIRPSAWSAQAACGTNKAIVYAEIFLPSPAPTDPVEEN